MKELHIYIIHGSQIIQGGLADLLHSNFNCVIKKMDAFTSKEINLHEDRIDAMILIQYELALEGSFISFAENFNANFISIHYEKGKGRLEHCDGSILLFDSNNDLVKQIEALMKTDVKRSELETELTNREIEVLKLVACGFSNKEIADKLFISTHTVISHRKNITEKLNIKSISGLTVYAIINNYIDTTEFNLKDLI